MLYSLIKLKVMTDGSLVLTPWKQHLEKMIGDLQELKADRRDIGIQYIEPRELDARIYFYNSNYRKAFVRTKIMNIDKGPLVLWLPDPLITVDKPFDYTFKPKTDDVKLALNSVYGVKSMTELTGAKPIHISTVGYDPALSWAGVGYKPILDTSMFDSIKPFTNEYKEDKNLDRKIKNIQINEKKKVVTIVWKDGEVTMAKCGPNDTWDPEKGVLVCVAKRGFTSGTKFNKWRKRVVPESDDISIPDPDEASLYEGLDDDTHIQYQPKHSATK